MVEVLSLLVPANCCEFDRLHTEISGLANVEESVFSGKVVDRDVRDPVDGRLAPPSG